MCIKKCIISIYVLNNEAQLCKTRWYSGTVYHKNQRSWMLLLQVECDKLQRIHTLENLSWLVEQEHCSPEDLSRLCIDVSTLGDKVRLILYVVATDCIQPHLESSMR